MCCAVKTCMVTEVLCFPQAKTELKIVTEEKAKFENDYYTNKHRREELEGKLLLDLTNTTA